MSLQIVTFSKRWGSTMISWAFPPFPPHGPILACPNWVQTHKKNHKWETINTTKQAQVNFGIKFENILIHCSFIFFSQKHPDVIFFGTNIPLILLNCCAKMIRTWWRGRSHMVTATVRCRAVRVWDRAVLHGQTATTFGDWLISD